MLISRQCFASDDAPGTGPATAQPPAGATPPAEGAAPPQPTPAEKAGETPKPGEKPAAEGSGIKGLSALFKSTITGEPVQLSDDKKGDKKPTGKREKAPEHPPSPDDRDKGKPKAKARPTPPPAPSLTPADIAAAAAEGVAKAMQAAPKPVAAAPEAPPPTLSADQQEIVRVLKKMEEVDGTKYKDISNRYIKSLQDLKEYAAKWQAEHPGQEFDETAEEHEAWFAQHDVDWEDRDYHRAEIKLEVDPVIDSERRKLNEKLSEVDRRQQLAESAPKIGTEQLNAAKDFWTEFGEEYKDIITDQGVNHAKLTELSKKDRLAFGIRFAAAQDLAFETGELYKVMNGLEPFMDKAPSPNSANYERRLAQYQAHQALSTFAGDQERYLMSRPADERVNERGETFVPAAEYYKLPEAQRAGKWTFSFQDLRALRAQALAREAKEKITKSEEQYRIWAEDHGLAVPPKREEHREPGSNEQDGEAGNPNGKPQSPSSGGESRLAAAKTGASAPPPGGASSFVFKGI